MHTNTHTHSVTHTHIRACMHSLAHTHTHTQTYMHACMHALTSTHVSLSLSLTHTHTHTDTHTHRHTHTHTHTTELCIEEELLKIQKLHNKLVIYVIHTNTHTAALTFEQIYLFRLKCYCISLFDLGTQNRLPDGRSSSCLAGSWLLSSTITLAFRTTRRSYNMFFSVTHNLTTLLFTTLFRTLQFHI